MMSLRTQTLTLAISNIGTALLSFLLAALIARALGEAGLGAYAVALAWVMPLSLLVEFGVGTLITREIAGNALTDTGYFPEQLPIGLQGDLVAAAVRARLLLGTPTVLLFVLLAPLLTDDVVVIQSMQVSAPLIVIQPLFSTYSAVFRARGAMAPIPWLNIGMLLVQVALTFVVLNSFGLGACVLRPGGCTLPSETPPTVVAVLVVNTFTSAAQLGACWLIFRTRFYVPATGKRMPVLALLRESGHFGLAALFAAVQLRMSTVLLEALRSASAVGLYAGANRFIEAARLLPNAFYGALFPSLGGLARKPPEMRRTFRRAMWLMFAYGCAVAVILTSLAQPLLVFTYGEAFGGAVPVLSLLSAAFVFSLLRGTLTLYRYAQRREVFVNRVNGAVIVAQLALSVVLIPGYGTVGAALAVLGAEIIAFLALGVLAPPDPRAFGDDDIVLTRDQLR